MTREFGTALGVALLGAIVSAGYRDAIGSRLGSVPRGAADGVATALAVAGGGGPQAQALIQAARESFVEGWQRAMWAGAGVLAVLLVYVLARGPAREGA